MTDFALRTAFSIPRYLATKCVKIRFRYIPQIEINHSLTVFPGAQKCFFSGSQNNTTNKKQKRKKKCNSKSNSNSDSMSNSRFQDSPSRVGYDFIICHNLCVVFFLARYSIRHFTFLPEDPLGLVTMISLFIWIQRVCECSLF